LDARLGDDVFNANLSRVIDNLVKHQNVRPNSGVTLKAAINGSIELALDAPTCSVLDGLYPARAATLEEFKDKWPAPPAGSPPCIQFSALDVLDNADRSAPVDVFGWSFSLFDTLMVAGDPEKTGSTAHYFMCLLRIIANGGGPDSWWHYLRLGLGTPLDKTKDHSKPKDPQARPKVRPIGKPSAFYTLVADIALRKCDKAILESLSSPYQLAKGKTSGCDVIVQAFFCKYPTACCVIHDAANAYNEASLQHVIAHTSMLKRMFLEPRTARPPSTTAYATTPSTRATNSARTCSAQPRSPLSTSSGSHYPTATLPCF